MKHLALTTIVLLGLGGAIASAQAETLSVTSTSGAPGDLVTVSVLLGNNTNGVAGTAFTLAYDTTRLSLNAVRSDFFPLFSNQNISPPTVEIDGRTYDRAVVVNPEGTMLAAARTTNGELGNQELFQLDFTIAANAPVGESLPIRILPSQISNSAAGYDTLTTLPLLVGIDGETYPERPVSLPTGAGAIAVTGFIDLDGDGIDDAWEILHFGNTTTANATSDFDGDGYSDLTEYLNWVAGIGDPAGASFSPTTVNAPGGAGYQEPATTVQDPARDFNNDGISDLLARDTGNWRTYIYTINDSRISAGNTIATFRSSWTFHGVGDFNADGTADILTRNGSNGRTYIYTIRNSAIASYVNFATFSNDWELAGVGDFNGDGTADILARNRTNGRTYIYTMANARIASYTQIATFPSSWQFIGIGDFNGDATDDILVRNDTTGATYIYTMNDSRISSYSSIGSFSSAWDFTGIGDFNGDGTSDLLVRNASTGQTYVYTVGDARIAAYHLIATVPSSWEFAPTGDYNGDGTTDLLMRNTDNGETYIYTMANGQLASYYFIATFSSNWRLE